jgi:intraflagellar transport protein 122
MLAYLSYPHQVSTFPVYTQKLTGLVAGFKGSRIYCLNVMAVNTVDIPHTVSMKRYLERGDCENAYRVACLGVTDDDWKILAMDALQNGLNIEIARKAFIRVRDIKYLQVCARSSVLLFVLF